MPKTKFKVGDKIKYKSDHILGRPSQDKGKLNEYTILAVDEKGRGYIYRQDNPDGISGTDYKDFTWQVELDNVDIISSKTIYNNMNILEKFALMTKAEPEKSFIKAGIMEVSGALTEDGANIFTMYLLNKFGADFKKEVVDGLIADEKED